MIPVFFIRNQKLFLPSINDISVWFYKIFFNLFTKKKIERENLRHAKFSASKFVSLKVKNFWKMRKANQTREPLIHYKVKAAKKKLLNPNWKLWRIWGEFCLNFHRLFVYFLFVWKTKNLFLFAVLRMSNVFRGVFVWRREAKNQSTTLEMKNMLMKPGALMEKSN